MFEGFALERIDVGQAVLRVRHGGSGPPVLVLHGHPRTHATWHRVAPLLADGHTVVCPDLRGYGQSSKPPTDDGHTPYSKRAMARDCLELMRRLGHDRFAVLGHDRGSYVAYRLALDAPEAVTRLAVGDCIPISEHLARCDERFARAWYHWFFFAVPDKPERAILADPAAWYGGSEEAMGAEAWEDYQAAIRNPATVRAMLEDYRAGLTVDRRHEEADRAAGRRITCPVLVLWSEKDDLGDLYPDIPGIWRNWADDVTCGTIDSGHHMAEEAPEQLAGALRAFLAPERTRAA
ncbi:alpha/beta fold hydrolase [Streptomyces chitinivorans]|uniref:Alpha/beta fold hydrolase n=1 Tax=Streptomyces chitinivorans TaxID=1257027 RepID=A0ABW7HZX6_9ACTN|nr:alpha/beta hydrolase [Streptomyces chitinivorans]MDH2412024.1 alpha/beta hydrolase [Streptomyces chitinivorans]